MKLCRRAEGDQVIFVTHPQTSGPPRYTCIHDMMENILNVNYHFTVPHTALSGSAVEGDITQINVS